jgi:hypothetical protein
MGVQFFFFVFPLFFFSSCALASFFPGSPFMNSEEEGKERKRKEVVAWGKEMTYNIRIRN